MFCIRSFPNWGLSLVHSGNTQIHASPLHSHGLQSQPLGLVWVPSAANPLQLCNEHFHHTGCRSNKLPHNCTFKIVSNYFQLWPPLLPSPWWHLLLQREEDDGNKFEKIMPRSTVPSQLGSNSIQLLVQNCRSQRENLWIIWEHLGSVLHQTYQHQRGVPAKNNVTALQIQSGDTIRVNPGCYIRMIDHVISADESEII